VAERIRNPFTYGDLVSDESFTDRREELAQLEADVHNGQNVAVIAPRRFGKSSLVRAALSDLIAEGVLVVEVDLMSAPTKERLAGKLAKSINDDIAPTVFKAKEHLRVFSSLRVAPVMTVDSDGSMSFSFSPTSTRRWSGCSSFRERSRPIRASASWSSSTSSRRSRRSTRGCPR
jgi:uncharacterized protein